VIHIKETESKRVGKRNKRERWREILKERQEVNGKKIKSVHNLLNG